jgi:adenosine/AMP kinase
LELEAVPIEKPEELNVIVGQSHFIKTIEDLHEALAGSSVVDGKPPLGVESEQDVGERKRLLRQFGYKL